MKVIYFKEHNLHDPSQELDKGKLEEYMESSDRLTAIREHLDAEGYDFFGLNSDIDPDRRIAAAHDAEMINFLRTIPRDKIIRRADNRIVHPSDEGISVCFLTDYAARASVHVALTGAHYVQDGDEVVYALCRPPGHHATKKQMGGYCFFNNAAIAAQYLAEHGRVGVLDIDLHHGNGTQDILLGSDIWFVSLNGEGVYPNITERRESCTLVEDNVVNIPVPATIRDNEYLALFDTALEKFPELDFLVVSAGFDTSINELKDLEPVETVGLERRCYQKMGRRLRDFPARVLVVQEGGYNTQSLPQDVGAFLSGFKK